MFHIPPHQKLKIGFISDLSGVYRIAAEEPKKTGIAFISIGQVHELTTSYYLGSYTLHQAYTPYMIGQAMGKWISENIGKKWFLFFTDYMWGWRVHDSYIAVAKRTGSEIVGYKRIP